MDTMTGFTMDCDVCQISSCRRGGERVYVRYFPRQVWDAAQIVFRAKRRVAFPCHSWPADSV